MLLVAHKPDSTSIIQRPTKIVRQHLQWFPENRLCDSKLNVQHYNHINLCRKELISSSLIN